MEILADLENPLVMRRCPRCGMVTTMCHFLVLKKDESMDIFQDDFYRCLRCLSLYEPSLTLTEVEQ